MIGSVLRRIDWTPDTHFWVLGVHVKHKHGDGVGHCAAVDWVQPGIDNMPGVVAAPPGQHGENL